MVEVFKTNVHEQEQAQEMLSVLMKIHPGFKVNFDLDDCDRILRVEGSDVQPEGIIKILCSKGFECEVLN